MYDIFIEGDSIKFGPGIDKSDIAISIKATGELIPVVSSDLKILSKTQISINNHIVSLDDIEALNMHQIASEYVNKENIYLKDVESKIPDPEGFDPLYAACIRAIKLASPRAVTQAQHDKKLAYLRELSKVKTGEKGGMSVRRLEELLSYYNLDMTDIVDPKYLK